MIVGLIETPLLRDRNWCCIPCNKLHATVKMFHDCGATIHPVTAVQIRKSINFLYYRPMNVTANGTIQFPFTHMSNDRIFKIKNKADSSFDLAFDIARERPVSGASKSPAQPRQINIQVHQHIVRFVAQNGYPSVMAGHLIEFITVQ